MPSGITVLLVVILAALFVTRRRIVARWNSPRARTVGTAGLIVAALLTVATAVGLLAGAGVLPPGPVRWISAVGLTWLATIFYLLITLIVLGIVWVGARIAVRLRPGLADGARRLLRTIAAVGLIGAVTATVYGLFEASSPRITHTDVALPAAPAEPGDLKIALITDLHVGPVRTRAFTQRVVDATNAQKPDVVILGGDLIDGTVEQIGEYLAPLKDLRSPFVFAVTGNHEYYADDARNWVQRWREVGVRPLINESVRIWRDGPRGGSSVTFVGVNDRKGKEPLGPDYDAALAGVSPGEFTVAVAHEPKQATEFARRGVDLQLAGHTHGGQLWPFRYLVRLDQPTIAGLEQVDGMPVYTSRGAGAWGPPVRVAAPPEIAIVNILSR
ncbi:metallophosphoesterase [Nocardiopsis tropica]|uniref:metallophosphoesterase n=1 Tax=Tsukamurella strandjordii TaxID=147577 RepID=UPI0031E251C0